MPIPVTTIPHAGVLNLLKAPKRAASRRSRLMASG